MLNDQPVFYDIEYATAHHEAVMTRAKAITLALLQGPTPMDRDLAAATATLLESEIATMKKTIVQVEKAVHAHYKRPEDRKVSTANAQRSMELLGLLERFEQHIDTHFPDTSHNERSVRIYLALFPTCNLTAVQYLNSEVITRDPQDPTHQGYRTQCSRSQTTSQQPVKQ